MLRRRRSERTRRQARMLATFLRSIPAAYMQRKHLMTRAWQINAVRCTWSPALAHGSATPRVASATAGGGAAPPAPGAASLAWPPHPPAHPHQQPALLPLPQQHPGARAAPPEPDWGHPARCTPAALQREGGWGRRVGRVPAGDMDRVHMHGAHPAAPSGLPPAVMLCTLQPHAHRCCRRAAPPPAAHGRRRQPPPPPPHLRPA